MNKDDNSVYYFLNTYFILDASDVIKYYCAKPDFHLPA